MLTDDRDSPMNLKQLWSIIRGRKTNFSWMNASWTYYPNGDPMRKHDAVEAAKQIQPDPIRRRIATEEGCQLCAELAQDRWGPHHDPSPRCESGKRPHCTCDICF